MIEILHTFSQKPFIQSLVFLFVTLCGIVFLNPKNVDNAWNIAGLVFIAFIVVNAVCIWFADNRMHYFFYSLGFSVFYLACIAILLPIGIRLLNIEGSGESAMVFIFILYHPVLLLMVLFVKWGVEKFF